MDAGGLYYMRARWYDPNLGRFLSEDPIGLAGGINPYSFIGNSPMDGRDPSGLDHCEALQLTIYTEFGPDGTPRAHSCGGAGPFGTIALAPINAIVQGSNPFSTPRSQGTSANFGQRGNGLWDHSSPMFGPSYIGVEAFIDRLDREERATASTTVS